MGHRGKSKRNGSIRKPGDWIAISNGRRFRKGYLINYRNTAIPANEPGSAAYRRMTAR